MSRFPAVPTNSDFASALAFGFSFVADVIHGIDLQGVIVSGMVSSRVPLSSEHVVFDERVPDTGIRGCRTKIELQRGCRRFHQGPWRLFPVSIVPTLTLTLVEAEACRDRQVSFFYRLVGLSVLELGGDPPSGRMGCGATLAA